MATSCVYQFHHLGTARGVYMIRGPFFTQE